MALRRYISYRKTVVAFLFIVLLQLQRPSTTSSPGNGYEAWQKKVAVVHRPRVASGNGTDFMN